MALSDDRRIVCWFSAGAASAVATKLILKDYEAPIEIVYTDPGSEHPDNQRFVADCEQWFGQKVTQIRSEKYRDTWQVFEERRFLNSPQGALCTAELKKKPRFAFQRPDDIQVFGYTIEEEARAERFREQNPDVTLWCPLIGYQLTKSDCLAMIERAGIELPTMYRLGYRNNNCIGCVKGGMGYWNKIRRDFPNVFWKMAELEEEIGATVLRVDGEPLPLSLLDPDRGNASDEPDFECSLLCHMAEAEMIGKALEGE